MSNTGFNKHLWIFFLNTYNLTLLDEISPIEIIHILSLDTLLLTKYEFNDVRNAIFNLTSRYPDLCQFILTLLRTKFREGIQNKSSVNLSHDEAEFIRLVLLSSHYETPFIIDYASNPISKKFLKSSIFVEIDNQIQFTAPIMQIILTHYLFANSAKQPTITFEEFLEKSIHCMNPSKLSELLKKGDKSSIYERSWQIEWYCTSTIVVLKNESISDDVSPAFSSASFLDFILIEIVARELSLFAKVVF
ncbi:3243_t:CDS:2 [Funneliformis caledonium]|uniref:3243_t:CDS:1 n=1 Tax=Funneliformis caledonium TaxID=1117310 RepID=A0A9N9FCD7_9GLOM|nr:3243_t:CDS:2 [Funneliformis caledonium]